MPRIALQYYLLAALALTLACLAEQSPAQAPQEYDVVVYGGTSAAVTAAIEVARMGKSVVIVSPDHHLGGMTSNGLGWTDIGDRDTIGGLSREFYQRIYEHYLEADAWTTESRQTYINRSSLDPDNARQMMFTFEPKVAKQVFEEMVAEANVPVAAGRLDRSSGGVTMANGRIASIRTEGGAVYSGKAFIDATYEGDLFAAAGVSYEIGREANAKFGETLNGVQVARSTKNQLPAGIDPYIVKGDPASGLLPGVNPNAGGVDGSADNRLQTYNYRMVLTNKPENRVAIAKPANYDAANYELLFRAIEAGQTGGFFKLDAMPNNKTDSNNTGGFSTDFIGGNYDLARNVNYAEADYATREAMNAAHRDFQLGLIWSLQNSPRVPANIRNNWAMWGLPADEFTDNNNWPSQLYVREARRLVGELTIDQTHVDQEDGIYSDSVGMGGYNMDSHHVQRIVGPDGFVMNEGDVQVSPAKGPYPISYRAMVAKQGEADNLIVPVALSATHIAYGSIRMEPVFMTLGQSAGAAAVLLGDHAVAARDVPYALLRSRMIREEQILGAAYKSPDAGISLNFGAVVANNANSPGHALGGIPGENWNLISGDVAGGIVNSRGEQTAVAVNLGKSAPDAQSIDWNAGGFGTILKGTSFNTGLYAGNASSAMFVNDGKDSRVDLGVRVSGLTEGIYDAFVTAKNTNAQLLEQYNVYALAVDADSGATAYGDVTPILLSHGIDVAWRHRESVVAETIKIGANQDLVIVVEGLTAGEMRGFVNTLEIVKLAGPLSADVNRDGLVDLDDFHLIRANFLNNVSLGVSGDANSDGRVDHRDFFFWRSAYLAGGGSLAALNGVTVPEPSLAAELLVFAPLLSHLWSTTRSGQPATREIVGCSEHSRPATTVAR
ncbi:FAD-dependent oxidoreductase [Lacipirellula parvula]|uniref:Putative secreted protein-putative xanthan lyase related n=1 Tax=Lacipirellula parvula TaxID=2650471 RepID=A0A5K7XA75_9BACT|nr:FAD-dependent oxidoreductase [Lacipirellula parvula]BBO31216.1 putative secreted protein-putative xanthan lyase related [Lacipirellula parvula]